MSEKWKPYQKGLKGGLQGSEAGAGSQDATSAPSREGGEARRERRAASG